MNKKPLTDTNEALVSIVITTRNRESFLINAVNSVVNQSYKNLEIIIVDDASTDGTNALIKSLMKNDERIKYVQNSYQKGSNPSRNIGIKMANGHFIAGLDDDDEFLPNRIERLVSSYDPAYAFISSYNIVIKRNSAKHYIGKKTEVSFRDLLNANHISNQGLVEKNRLLSVGLYDETLKACQDYDLWLRLTQKYGSAKILPEYLQIIHEEHTLGRISSNSRAKKTAYWNFYQKYKPYMDKNERKNQIFNIYHKNEKTLSFKNALTLMDSDNHERVLDWHIRTSRSAYKILTSFSIFLLSLSQESKYILYGYGTIGKLVARVLGKAVVAVIDESIDSEVIDGFKVINIEDLPSYFSATVLITPIMAQDEIIKKISPYTEKYQVIDILV